MMPAIDGVEKGGINDVHLQPWKQPSEKAPLEASRPSFMNVFDRHMCYPFFIRLCEYLSIAEMIALKRTCKKYADLYQYLLPIQWDVNCGLRRFVRDPCGIRSQMAKSDAFIAGSFVVQFFERTSWKPSDLDIFIEVGECANTFQRYLLDKEGYEISNGEDSEYEPDYMATDYIPSVFILTKSGGHAQTGHEEQDCAIGRSVPRICLVATIGQPIQSILKGCSSTAVVNFMSWNKAYSIYPLSTFVQYKGYKLDREFTGLIRLQEHHNNHPIRKYRRVDDEFTWTVPFDTKNVQWSENPDQVLKYQSFGMTARIGTAYGLDEPIACNIGAMRAIEKTMGYRYWCSTDLSNFLHWHFKNSILMEPHDSGLSARPSFHVGTTANCDGPSLNCTGDSEKSKSRASREAEFPAWYRKWERPSRDENGYSKGERWSRDENGFPEYPERYVSELGPPE